MSRRSHRDDEAKSQPEAEGDDVTFRLERRPGMSGPEHRAWCRVTINGHTDTVDTGWQPPESFAIKLSAARALEKRGFQQMFAEGLVLGS